MASSRESFTEMLQRHRQGDEVALGEMLPLVYEELRTLARQQFRSRDDAHTLQPTALVNEVYLRLVDQTAAAVADRAHFRGLCARVMRQVLVDHARSRNADKRGGGAVQRLDTAMDVGSEEGPSQVDVLALDEAIGRLAALDLRKARVVELRIFGGQSVAEVAAALDVSSRTVEADWFFARAWLRGQIGPG